LIKQNVQHDIAFAHSIGVRDSNIDRAFKRYRQTGDPAWMAQVFDATAGELMRLGWHLTGDRHLAEDLVQATFLVAMEDAEAFTDERRIMPWLCGILANRARQLRRQARGRARHTIEPRTDVVDPVSEAATQELQAEVSQSTARISRALPSGAAPAPATWFERCRNRRCAGPPGCDHSQPSSSWP
jgi:DNA-directed RNA polymerase specialized sigma24 family protein